jgi:hypothetical protein
MGQISGTWELLLRDYWRKSMIIGEKNTDLKRLTGQLTLRFLTEIGWFHWNQGKKVAHFAWFGEPWCSCKSMCTIWSRWPIRIIIFEMQWNLSKIHWTNFCVQNGQFIQVKLTKNSYTETLFKIRFIQDSSVFRVWYRQVSLYMYMYTVPLLILQIFSIQCTYRFSLSCPCVTIFLHSRELILNFNHKLSDEWLKF